MILEPDVFFLLLPPLPFLDGWRIPNDDLLRDASTIFKLAPGLVVLTVIGVGFFIHWTIPATPLAVAFALAAVISPTDPIAVTAIAADTPIAARMMRVLEGEALPGFVRWGTDSAPPDRAASSRAAEDSSAPKPGPRSVRIFSPWECLDCMRRIT